MNTCRNCGQQTTWVRKFGKWLPPLEYAGRAFLLVREDDGSLSAVEHATYQIHECRAEDVEDYQRRVIEQQRVFNASENFRLAQWEYAILQPCTKCGVAQGDPCLNLNDAKRDVEEVRTVRWPHPARMVGWDPEARKTAEKVLDTCHPDP